MKLSDLKITLSRFDKKKLTELILDLYKANKSAKEYIDIILNPNEHNLLGKQKEEIFEAFFPKRGDDLKLKDGKKAISDFKIQDTSKSCLADLMIYYVECGVKYTNEYGDIDEAFYSSLEKMYLKALSLIQTNELINEFKARALKIVNDTEDIGWGFHDSLADTIIMFTQTKSENKHCHQQCICKIQGRTL